ncbi:MAG TPA: DUF6293 family protein [Nitrososphaeraceae archaeon]|nr:DUF6293 family protein [Nitrososphaeraceae archaeon]
MRKKSDRVWLIIDKPSHQEDKGSSYAESIAKGLKASNIECQQASADRIDLFDILRALRTIIIHEKGNHILVNVSVGSKIQVIASMMACMMFRDVATIKPYYVVPEKYNTILLEEKRNQETEGMKDIITLPEYKIEIPNEKLIEYMHLISQHKDNKITKRELKDLALDRNLIQVGKKGTQDEEERSDQAAYMALNKNLIEPLMDWKFISVEKVGSRHIVSLTDKGINALRFLYDIK